MILTLCLEEKMWGKEVGEDSTESNPLIVLDEKCSQTKEENNAELNSSFSTR